MFNTDSIQSPKVILNSNRSKLNIIKLAKKAELQGIQFRPHFKTHQSAEIGTWFRDVGVSRITVSSVNMAKYFANNGWEDILIAFPINVREIEKIIDLSRCIHLGLLIDNVETFELIKEKEALKAGFWIKIDTGMGRAGIWWEDEDCQYELAKRINDKDNFVLRGLLTHSGQTYHARSTDEIRDLYTRSVNRMNRCREKLQKYLKTEFMISTGDTPGCWLNDDLGNVDEIRPGNFIFFDAMMYKLGVCRADEIALCVACPIVGKYDNRQEVVIFGGAAHLSKEMIEHSDPAVYGYAVTSPDCSEWKMRESNYVRSLSQEHGIVKLDKETFDRVNIGDLIYIVPVHSCLVVGNLGDYLTFDGEKIGTRLNS